MGYDGKPCLYQTDPSGIYSAWKATAIGRSSKTVREFLEKHYLPEMTNEHVLKLTVRSLLEVVQTGSKNIEVAYMDHENVLKELSQEEVDAIAAEIEKEKVEEAEKKSKKTNTSAA
jgi:20S proteasome subunit alpha 4